MFLIWKTRDSCRKTVHTQLTAFHSFSVISTNSSHVCRWLCSVVVRATDSWSRDCEFDSRPVHCHIVREWLGMCLVTKQYNLVSAKGQWCSAAGKVTVGLASHWRHITNLVVYSPMGSTANVRYEHPTYAPAVHVPTLPFITHALYFCLIDITYSFHSYSRLGSSLK